MLGKIDAEGDSTGTLSADLVTRAAEFISHYEGLRTTAYYDTGAWAICYGNRSYEGESATKEDCWDRLLHRTRGVLEYVEKNYSRTMTDNQKIALASLSYNVRDPRHVMWRANNGYSDNSVASAIEYYTYAGGVELPGLVKRRNDEAALFLTK